MLVLSRKPGERIRLGDNIWLTISRIRGNKVTLGIDAPSDVKVAREEITVSASEVAALAAS